MKGTIIVAAANVPPTVTITNPASGTVFAAPASVTIQASASDSDGTVTNVQFLVGRKRGDQQGRRPLFRRHQQPGGGQLHAFRRRFGQ